MSNYLPWNRNYSAPENFIDSQTVMDTGFSGWRTEIMELPINVFIDIYGLLDHLIAPGNLQLRGRRGTGKTMYFLKGQDKIGQEYFSKKYSDKIAAYIDLKTFHDFKEVPSFLLRSELRYRRLIRSIVSGTLNVKTVNQYCLQDYLSTLGFIRRRSAQNILKKIIDICDQDAKYFFLKIDVIVSTEQNLLAEGNTQAIRNLDIELFSESPSRISHLLHNFLEIINCDQLIVYIDEFSSPTIPQLLQLPLLDRLAKTFNGNELSVKIATVPGTTIIYDDSPISKNKTTILSKNRFEIFDFEAQLPSHPRKIQTGIFEIFLRNLAYSNNEFMKYLDSSNPIAGFNQFISDQFAHNDDFLEFLKSGDGLPRQLLETFYSINIIRKSAFPNQKITKYMVQLASRQSLKITYQSQIRGSKQCEKLLSKIYDANSRIIKIEKNTAYDSALALLTHWGFIYACPIPPTIELDISPNPLVYYFTSYRTEVGNQMSRNKKNDLIKVDDLTYIAKDKFKELYPKAKVVLLSDQ